MTYHPLNGRHVTVLKFVRFVLKFCRDAASRAGSSATAELQCLVYKLKHFSLVRGHRLRPMSAAPGRLSFRVKFRHVCFVM